MQPRPWYLLEICRPDAHPPRSLMQPCSALQVRLCSDATRMLAGVHDSADGREQKMDNVLNFTMLGCCTQANLTRRI